MTVAREVRRLIVLHNQLLVAGYDVDGQVQTSLDGCLMRPALEAEQVLRGLVRDAPLGDHLRRGCQQLTRTVLGLLDLRDCLRGSGLGQVGVGVARLHRHDPVLKALQTAFPGKDF
jgi:hypothetical protein